MALPSPSPPDRDQGIERLGSSALAEFAVLLPPGWWSSAALGSERERTALAVGTRTPSGEPAGVAVATLLSGGRPAMLAWLAVERLQRSRGVAGRLVEEVERWAAERGAAEIGAVFFDGKPSSSALRRVFERAGWGEPRLELLQYTADRARFPGLVAASERWLRRAMLPRGLEIVPWISLDSTAHEAIGAGERESGLPDGLSPFLSDPARADPHTSMAILDRDAGVVGWLITQVVAPGAVLYDRLFVEPTLRGIGAGHAMGSAALVAQRSRDGDGGQAACRCHVSNRAMLAFAERRLATHASSIGRAYLAKKRLSQ